MLLTCAKSTTPASKASWIQKNDCNNLNKLKFDKCANREKIRCDEYSYGEKDPDPLIELAVLHVI